MDLNFGMPYGFAQALAQKYAILKQNADAQTVTANSGAHLDDVRAGLLPAESAANVGLTKAQTAQTAETTKYVGPLAKANIFNTRAQGHLFGSQATGEDQLNKMSTSLFKPKVGLPAADDALTGQLRSILREGLGY